MDNPIGRFVHRRNADRTIDSICTTCFVTVCQEATLTLARDGENKHMCPGSIDERRNARANEILLAMHGFHLFG
jgi:hypothetical protein